MELITEFLANPIVSLTGYILSFISAFIAIIQYRGKVNAQVKVEELQLTLSNYHIKMGDKSQNFNNNIGPVKIDNRG